MSNQRSLAMPEKNAFMRLTLVTPGRLRTGAPQTSAISSLRTCNLLNPVWDVLRFFFLTAPSSSSEPAFLFFFDFLIGARFFAAEAAEPPLRVDRPTVACCSNSACIWRASSSSVKAGASSFLTRVADVEARAKAGEEAGGASELSTVLEGERARLILVKLGSFGLGEVTVGLTSASCEPSSTGINVSRDRCGAAPEGQHVCGDGSPLRPHSLRR